MTSSVIVLLLFALGGVAGMCHFIPQHWLSSNLPMAILSVLIFQVGISIGSNKNLKEMIRGVSLKMLLVPLSTIAGTLAFSVLASLLISQWGMADCLAVGSGFAYYSLSSVLITELKEASVGIQVATELGTLALLANIIREMMSLLGAPIFSRFFGKLAPISAAGINSMDVLLPMITRCSGKHMVPLAILHGIILELTVPFLVSFFCKM